jgi:hypothetical protein
MTADGIPDAGLHTPAPPVRAEVAHVLPGRLRVRVPSRQRDAAWFAEAARVLEAMPGTGPVTANPVSASLLILHREPSDQVLAFARARGLFDAEVATAHAVGFPPTRAFSHEVKGALERADLALRFASGGRSDLRSMTFAALVLGAAVQAVRGQLLPAAGTLLAYALSALPRRDEG